MNESSQWKLGNIYSSPKLVFKMKLNKLLGAQIIISIHAWRGRAMKLKSAWYQLDDDILLKRNFDSHLWKNCIQAYATRYKDCHKTTSLRKKMQCLYTLWQLNIHQYKGSWISILLSLLFTLWLMMLRLVSLCNPISLKSLELLILCSWN